MAKKVLIIDDEPHILLVVANRLRANGFEVVSALSGPEGLERVKKEKPDLILLDFVMPEMMGDEVLRRLKSDPETQGIPVIFLTADVKSVNASESAWQGAEAVVFKPFTPPELFQAIAKVLSPKV